MVSMGFNQGLPGLACKRKFRWTFEIEGVSDGVGDSVNTLPPSKAARPNLQFKEMIAQHVSETVYYPAKPEWKPIQLVLWDTKRREHPVFKWIREFYRPKSGTLFTPNENDFIKPQAKLKMLDGCGKIIEEWTFEDVWPQMIDFQDLDMASSDIVVCQVTLRYVRAYLEGTGSASSPKTHQPHPNRDVGAPDLGPTLPATGGLGNLTFA